MTAYELEKLNRETRTAEDALRVDTINAQAAKDRASFAANMILPGVIGNLQAMLATCDRADAEDVTEAANLFLEGQAKLNAMAARKISSPPR